MFSFLTKQVLFATGLFLLALNARANSCADDNVSLQVLGSGGPEIDDGRFSSSYLVKHQNKAAILIDAGSGASFAFGESGAKFEDVQAILLTHLHVDHSVDLPAFVKGSYFTNRVSDLSILGPSGNRLMPATSEYVNALLGSNSAYPYLEEYVSSDITSDYNIKVQDVPLERNKVFSYQVSSGIQVQAVFVHHGPVAAVAWRVNIANCSVTFSGDMSNQFEVLANLAKDSDILVAHNAVPEKASKIAKNLHMPPSVIGKVAKQANVKKLVLSHFMNRTLSVQKQTLAIIRKHYSGPIKMATDGAEYLLSGN